MCITGLVIHHDLAIHIIMHRGCCLDVPTISRAIKASVSLDACHLKMNIAIEKLSANIFLFDYDWGEWYIYIQSTRKFVSQK